MNRGAVLHAVVYDGDVRSRRAVLVIVEGSGIRVLEASGGVPDLVEHVRVLLPDLIVLELALSGSLGLGVVPALLAAVPGASVVLLSPFLGLREAARRAGAYELVDDSDLRELRRCVRRLMAERAVQAEDGSSGAAADPGLNGWPAGEEELELAVPVHQVTPVGAGEGPGDREAQAGTAPVVQAHEALEDPVGHPIGDPGAVVGNPDLELPVL